MPVRPSWMLPEYTTVLASAATPQAAASRNLRSDLHRLNGVSISGMNEISHCASNSRYVS